MLLCGTKTGALLGDSFNIEAEHLKPAGEQLKSRLEQRMNPNGRLPAGRPRVHPH